MSIVSSGDSKNGAKADKSMIIVRIMFLGFCSLFLAVGLVFHPAVLWAEEEDEIAVEEPEAAEEVVAIEADEEEINEAEEDKEGPEAREETRVHTEYEATYGKDLLRAPYSVRIAFANENDTPWEEASFNERSRFINQWVRTEQQEEQAEIKRKAEIGRTERRKEQERSTQKMTEEKKQNARIREREQRKIAEERKKMDFQRKKQEQQSKLNALRQRGQSTHSSGSSR
jgi:hypothetical protein